MRGQIWYVAKGKQYMENKGGRRPAIVVSKEEINSKTNRVMVVFLTTHESEYEEKIPVMVNGTQSYAICDNINTVFKDQMSCYAGTVDEETMRKIDEQMAKSLGLELKKKESQVESYCVGCDAEVMKQALIKENEKLEKSYKEIQNEAKFYKRAYEDLLAKVMAR